MTDLDDLCARVAETSAALHIRGGGSRRFPLPVVENAAVLELDQYGGVIEYYPEELVVRAKAGTRLTELIRMLGDEGQMLASDPPVHDDSSTVGGVVATGLSGSRRPYGAAIKDIVLGVGLILDDGTYAEFGGQVMKNVAGYDVSRLVCGSFGILGPIADVSLKVVPRPECETSRMVTLSPEDAMILVGKLRRNGAGISASCYYAGNLYLRFSGAEKQTLKIATEVGGDECDNDFWSQLDGQNLSCFEGADVWRLSTHPSDPAREDFQLMDWGFAQRWLINPASDPRIDYDGQGHWTRVQCPDNVFKAATFEPLSDVHSKLMGRVKEAFDPRGKFNPMTTQEE